MSLQLHKNTQSRFSKLSNIIKKLKYILENATMIFKKSAILFSSLNNVQDWKKLILISSFDFTCHVHLFHLFSIFLPIEIRTAELIKLLMNMITKPI